MGFDSLPQNQGTQNKCSRICLQIECYGCNFHLRSSISIENFISEQGDLAGELAIVLFQEFLTRFETEAAPELANVFGDTPPEFYQDSFAMMVRDDYLIVT